MLTFDSGRWGRYCEFQKIVGDDIDPVVVAHEWRASKQGTPKIVGMTLADAVKKYLLLRDDEKSWGDDAKRHAKKQLSRLVDKFGEVRLNAVGTEELRGWLRDLKDDTGKGLSACSIKDHRKNVNTFFDYCLREQWGALENPCARIKPPKLDDGDPVVIPIRDAFEFFKANRAEPVIGRVALEAFAGVRYTTAGKIEADAINFDGRGVRMAAAIHKSGKKDGRARYRQGHPDCLWKWLEHTPEKTWAMTALQYREAKRFASIRAGLRPFTIESAEDREKMDGLRNVWRHSFISYHLARFKSLPLTQYLAQHSSPKTTEEYEGIADQNDAARYFAITPETVLMEWEDFAALKVEAVPLLSSAAVAMRLGSG